MRMYDIIQKKRDNKQLSTEEINWFIKGYVADSIPDYQAAALCMAIYFNGMSDKETTDLTLAIKNSGDTVDLSMFNGLSVDKHSTGGVGDKTTLIVAPIVASLGGKVAKMSGRGLGHTGGTVDKLESISGYKTDLNKEDFLNQVEKIGVSVIGQTGNMTPGDKKLYALRDVTATVDSIPLIVSSIMSKKLAAGSDSIVLDVKCGSGAFMKTVESATELAEKMVQIGKMCSKKITALITNMDVPLGKNIGNALEVKEAIEVLKGKGDKKLREICVALSSQMLSLCHGWSVEAANEKVKKSLADGSAFNKFCEWISHQGGDISFIDDLDNFHSAKYKFEILSNQDGFIENINAEELGKAAVIIGAGREKKTDKIDFSAGIVLEKCVGDSIKKGEKLATVYSSTVSDLSVAQKRVRENIIISQKPPKIHELIYKIVK